ncbi:MAG: NUDIX hydrolase [Nitriliruptoraceae bacterium]
MTPRGEDARTSPDERDTAGRALLDPEDDLDGSVQVEAAGGIVLRAGTDGPEVLLVHRVRYGDWSLPKGKLDPGEGHRSAAVREVLEETGVHATPSEELRQLVYEVPAGRKRVRWYVMHPSGGDPDARRPDGEVDVATWVPVAGAPTQLTYPTDAELLAEALRYSPRGDHR